MHLLQRDVTTCCFQGRFDRGSEGVRREERVVVYRDLCIGLNERRHGLPEHTHRDIPNRVAETDT